MLFAKQQVSLSNANDMDSKSSMTEAMGFHDRTANTVQTAGNLENVNQHVTKEMVRIGDIRHAFRHDWYSYRSRKQVEGPGLNIFARSTTCYFFLPEASVALSSRMNTFVTPSGTSSTPSSNPGLTPMATYLPSLEKSIV